VSRTYTIGIVVFDGVLTSEVIGPAEIFATAGQHGNFGGAKTLLIGVEQQPVIRTEEGVRIEVDTTIADAPALDVLIVPGGNDVSHLLRNQDLNAFIQRQEEVAQWIGSVCAGAFVLGGAGALDGKQATTWYGGEHRLQAQFPAIQVVHDQPVVLDHRRITANGGLVSYRAALVLLGRLSSPAHAQEVYRRLGMQRLGTWEEIEATIRTASVD
jgi:transcriptional regulator GlxA family with amidase domain